MTDTSFMTEQRTTINGVPTYWGEAPGNLTAGLVFRVGQADESFSTRGHTHLIEHLALAAMGQEHFSYNGSVDQVRTTFIAQGRPDEVRDFLNGVVKALANLPFDRIEREVRILQTEASKGGGSLGKLLLSIRFGPAAHGLAAYEELGLLRAEPANIDAWRRSRFTAGNAVLWLSGPPPDGLDLGGLPDGDRVPVPAIDPVPNTLPGWYPNRGNVVAVSHLHPRSQEWQLACSVMQNRLRTRLREQEGRSYEVGADYEPLSRDLAYTVHYADTLEDEAEKVRDAFITECHRMAMLGVTEEEWADLSLERQRGRDHPYAAAGRATYAACEELCFGPAATMEELNHEFDALTPDHLRHAWRRANQSSVWALPSSIGMQDRRYSRVPEGSTWSVTGAEVRHVPGTSSELLGEVLVLAPTAFTLRLSDGTPLSIPYDACRAVEMWQDGARLFWAPDGIRVFLHPIAWVNGPAVIAGIEARIPSQRFVSHPEPSSYEHPWQTQPSGRR